MQPELKLPKYRGNGIFDWDPTHNVHPFWAIKRVDENETGGNLELTTQEFIFISTFDWWGNKMVKLANEEEAATATRAFHVILPVMTNTREIKADKEVMLKYQIKKRRRHLKSRLGIWVDNVQQNEKKRRISSTGK